MKRKQKSREITIKVAFVTTHYPPSTGFGGVTEAGFQLSRALAKLNINVSVITSDASLAGRISLKQFKRFEQPCLRISPYRFILTGKSAPSPFGHVIIKRVISECDIVHVNGIYTYPVTVAAWYARHLHKPYIVALRNGLDPYMFEIRRSKKMFGFRSYVKPILQRADAIHATAPQEVEHARSFGVNGNIVIIPNGVDTISPENLPKKQDADAVWPKLRGKRVVLFLSRLSPQKGLDMLIQSWGNLKESFTGVVLVLAGPDYQGFSRIVRQLVDRYGVRDSVVFTGEVLEDRKWALFRRADLFVLPSYAENFGNVIAEALAFEIPVLTTTATPWHMLDQYGCGFCVPPVQREIETTLKRLLAMPKTALRTMGAKSSTLRARLNTWEKSAQQFVYLYQKILSEHPGKD
ncbi:glycosyltransferase [candidate division KSB1 bacterium]|nr:glycosyltransferase [candidate division KSB1 bacterium]RQW05730.1 MAG: glycosyltransferase [candidate division KSB1 bacterium]